MDGGSTENAGAIFSAFRITMRYQASSLGSHFLKPDSVLNLVFLRLK